MCGHVVCVCMQCVVSTHSKVPLNVSVTRLQSSASTEVEQCTEEQTAYRISISKLPNFNRLS